MGINRKLSSSSNLVINMGGGPNLIQRSLFATNSPHLSYSQYNTPGVGSPAVSMSDWFHMNGLWRSRPFDLDTAGSEGATIKSREGGKRFVWIMISDHGGLVNFQAANDIYVGYSNDPQILPDPTTMRMIFRQEAGTTIVDEFGFSQTNFFPYHWGYLVYNPDSGGDKFWIYCEGQGGNRQHELCLLTTADFLTSTNVGPVIATTTFSGWTSLGYVHRVGVNDWIAYSLGKRDGSATSVVTYKYTSTDGLAWTEDYSTILAGPGEYMDVGAQKYLLTKESRTDNDYISLLAVDANRVSQGTYTRISTAFGPSSGDGSHYPGPTYLQDVWGYEEDGVMSIYATRGFFSSGAAYTLADGPYLGKSPTFFDITASITSNVLDVTVAGGTLAVGQQLLFLSGNPSITSLGTGSGGTGTYNVSATSNLASGTIKIATQGGLWHQFMDLYFYITDATAAASAAPLGVTADCVSGVVTISWNNCLPHQNYRVYRGTDATTQATLIGDVSGVSTTDTPTPGDQYFYKVVTMNGGEQGSRIVSVYASNNELMVNRHVNRFLNDGGDPSKIDIAFVATAAAALTSNDYWKYLMFWVDARFGYKLDGSGFVSKIFCLGTTRLPRWGDYTPTTSNTFPSTSSDTSYSATSFRGTTPSWINNASTARGYFGNGRANPIQRKNEITVIAAYQKPGTSIATLLGEGQFNRGWFLRHESGSSGNVIFSMGDVGGLALITATVPFASATAAHIAAGVFDGSNLTAYLDGVAGTPVDGSSMNNPTLVNDTALKGQYRSTASTSPVIISGGRTGLQTLSTRVYTNTESEALFTGACLAAFEIGSAQIVDDITTMYA